MRLRRDRSRVRYYRLKTVVCWGSDNSYGQLDVPTLNDEAVGISAGDYFTCVLLASGSVTAGAPTISFSLPFPILMASAQH